MFNPESLEPRRFFSASVAFNAASGALEVFGSKGDDNIAVTIVGDAKPGELETANAQTRGSVPLVRGINVYDNGQLISVYSQAYELAPRPEFKRVVDETIEWLFREMTRAAPDGS